MTVKEFFKKALSRYILCHLAAMLLAVVLIITGVWFWLGYYTHHGQALEVPNLEGMSFDKAYTLLDEQKLNLAVSDSGYNKKLPPQTILAQHPAPGSHVKQGRTIYVTLNSGSSPTAAIPDIIENSGYREAAARLKALGFKLTEPQRVPGQAKDYVIGVEAGGRRLINGEEVSLETPLTLIIGGGISDDEDFFDDDTEYADDGDLEAAPVYDEF